MEINRGDLSKNLLQEDPEPSPLDTIEWQAWALKKIDRYKAAILDRDKEISSNLQEIKRQKAAIEGFEAWIRNRNPVLRVYPPGSKVVLNNDIEATIDEVKIRDGLVVRYDVYYFVGQDYRNIQIRPEEIRQPAGMLPPSHLVEIED